MFRLDQLVARNLGVSRRLAERLIDGGELTDAGGRPLGDARGKLSPERLPLTVLWDGQASTLHAEFHLLQHKPPDCVTALRDTLHRTAHGLLSGAPLHAELRPVGRLDKDTSGLLLWTTDGQLLHRLTHPRFAVPRTYQAALARPFSPPPATIVLRDGHPVTLQALRALPPDGDELHPALARPADAALYAEVTLAGGAYHEVRRLFAALGSHVLALCRVRHGTVVLPRDLPAGHWRAISAASLTWPPVSAPTSVPPSPGPTSADPRA